jgi:transcriptional regulator with XRE-family HTH domain
VAVQAKTKRKIKQRLPAEVRQRLLDAFAEDLRHYRTLASLTQAELAAQAFMHVTEIGLLERGEREPRLSTLVRLSSVLDVPVERLAETALAVYRFLPNDGWAEA